MLQLDGPMCKGPYFSPEIPCEIKVVKKVEKPNSYCFAFESPPLSSLSLFTDFLSVVFDLHRNRRVRSV